MARLPDDEIQRRYEIALGQVEISDEEAASKWPNCSPEERERWRRMSMISRAKHSVVVDDETGQRWLGGSQPRKNKVDVMATIVELADGERQKEIVDALFAPLDKSEPAAVRGKGAERIIRMKVEQAELERRDREELRQLGKDELIDRLAKGIMGSSMGAELVKALTAAKIAPNGTAYDVDVTATDGPPPASVTVEFA